MNSLPSPKTKDASVDKTSSNIRTMFGDIAHRYDLLNRLLSGCQDVRWRRRAVRLLSVRRDWRVLDLCCGTGDLSFEIARQQPRCQVVSADFALPMLELAARKTMRKTAAKTPMLWTNADALHLPFADASFDAATVAFGVRNFEDTEAGLRELHRVLRSGGKLLILEFMRPQFPLLQKGFGAFNLLFSPVGRLISRHPTAYSYLPHSIDGFYKRSEFAELLQQFGFGELRKFEHSAGIATSFLVRKL